MCCGLENIGGRGAVARHFRYLQANEECRQHHVDTCTVMARINVCSTVQYMQHYAASLTSKSSDVIDDATRLTSSEPQEQTCNVCARACSTSHFQELASFKTSGLDDELAAARISLNTSAASTPGARVADAADEPDTTLLLTDMPPMILFMEAAVEAHHVVFGKMGRQSAATI